MRQDDNHEQGVSKQPIIAPPQNHFGKLLHGAAFLNDDDDDEVVLV